MIKPPAGKLLGALAVAAVLLAAIPAEAPVADAAMRGDVESVRSLLRNGADVNAAQGDGMTALHWAAENDLTELAEMLIYAGGNPEATTRIGKFAPLHVAAGKGSVGVVGALLTAGANLERRTTTGESPLHYAASSGSVDVVQALLGHGADIEAAEYSAGQTPLMFAAANGRTAVVEALLVGGAQPAVQTHVVDYPTMGAEDRIAARERHERLAVLHGEATEFNPGVDGTSADDDEEDEEGAADAEDVEETEETAEEVEVGATGQPQGAALEFGDPVAESQENEDDPEADENRKPFSYDQLVGAQGGNTALHYAVREGHRDVAMALLAAGADINQLSAGDQTSPLLSATLNGHFDLALELLEMGADPNLASAPGATPLYAAVHLQWVPKSFYPQQRAIEQQNATYLELMEALLKGGADPNPRLERHLWYTSFNHNVLGVDTWGATPFWRAAYGTDVEAMKLLVAYGADPSIPTRKPPGRVPTGNGQDEDGEKEDPSGLPPVEVAGPGVYPIHAASGVGYGLGLAGNAHRHAPNGWLPAVRYLVEELGADVNSRDYNGFAPLHNAAARGDVDMIHYLVDKGGDVTVLTRKGQTTADMANGPVQRVTVFPEVVALLESLGSDNNNNCVSCE